MSDYQLTISRGCVVVYMGSDGDEAGTVSNIDRENGFIEIQGRAGVLRKQDILAVGVYGDEAEFTFGETSDERISQNDR